MRETICFVALAALAKEGSNLAPVLGAYTRLFVRKVEQRGYLADADTLADHSFRDTTILFNEPFQCVAG